MSAKIMGMVFDLDLPVGEKLVMLAYADHADHQGGSIFPSTSLICKKTGYSESQVRRIVRSLEQKKLLVLLSGDKGGSGITKHYKIPLDEKGVIVTPFFEKRVSSDTEKGVIATAEKGVTAMTPEPSLTINLTINGDEKKLEGEDMITGKVITIEERKKSTEDAYFNSLVNCVDVNGVDISGYLEEVRPILEICYRLWGLVPPACRRNGKSKKGSRAIYWENSARELRSACGEFGLLAIEEYHKDFVAEMEKNKRKFGEGVAPHRVDSPNSLVNVVAGKAGELRLKSREISQDNSATQGLMGKVRIGDKLYINGKEIVDDRPKENHTGV